MTSELDESFGYQNVSQAERRAKIRRVFAAVAERYDVMNDLMSFALHRWWKQRFVACILRSPSDVIVDLAGGTGDIAIALARAGKRAIVCDPSVEMMAVGRRRGAADVAWVAAEAEALPFATASVDCVTIAFGIRNVTSLERALREIARVLKPGGLFYCLEFSTPRAWARPLYDFFSFFVIPRLGAAVARAPEAYSYLVEFDPEVSRPGALQRGVRSSRLPGGRLSRHDFWRRVHSLGAQAGRHLTGLLSSCVPRRVGGIAANAAIAP